MTRKKDLRFIIFFVVIASFCLLYLFQSSYAKYRKQINGQVQSSIANWNIKVNDEDIANKKTLEGQIIPVFAGGENSASGVIAPGVEGYYTITIDASDVDVSFRLTVHSDVSSESSITDLKTLTYSINPTSTTEEKLTYSPDTGIVQDIPRNSKKFVIRVYLKWDDDTGSMDNSADTDVALDDNSQALMNVKIHFSQLNS